MPTVLLRLQTGLDNPNWIPALQKTLTGFDLRIWPDAGDPSDIDYLVCWRCLPGDRTGWPHLKAVMALGAGVDQYIGHPDFPANAKLIRMIEPGLAKGMAEYIASWVLRFHREHDRQDDILRAGGWDQASPRLASTRRVGFMGLGEMARASMDALRPFGFDLRGWSRSAHDLSDVSCFDGPAGLMPFLAETEILVCLLPLTAETENILNRERMAQLPRGAAIINAARGGHIVDDDLIALLNEGRLSAAALDVFRTEPLPADHPFRRHPKIHLSSHIAAHTSRVTGAFALRQAIDLMERGEAPPGLVDVTREY